MNVMARLEFEIAYYYDVAVKHVSPLPEDRHIYEQIDR